MPQTFSFNDSFFTQDLRLMRRFRLGAARRHVDVSVDVFDLFNSANLVGFGSDLTQPASFGQASDRVGFRIWGIPSRSGRRTISILTTPPGAVRKAD